MNNITNIFINPLKSTKYMSPCTLHFTQNGQDKTWDLITAHAAVATIVFNVSRNVLVFVKQFRPAVYMGSIPEEHREGTIDVVKYPAELGISLEFCGGMIDKSLPLQNIAAEEILEECGYKVDPNNLEIVARYRSGVGRVSAPRFLYYCEVTDDMKISKGGGIEDEIIEIVEMTIPDVKNYIKQNMLSPPSFLAGIYWFLHNKVV